MPYEIQMDNEDCQGHAVVKLDDGQYYGLPRNTRRSRKTITSNIN